MPRLLAGLLLAFALAGAQAHSDEFMDTQLAPHGGMVRMAGAVHLELVRGAAPMVYVTDHANRPQDTAGATGSVRIEAASGVREILLEPAGGNALRAAAGASLEATTPVVVSVQLKDAPVASARFVPKATPAGHAGH